MHPLCSARVSRRAQRRPCSARTVRACRPECLQRSC